MILLFAPQPMEEENVRISNLGEQRNDHNWITAISMLPKCVILLFAPQPMEEENVTLPNSSEQRNGHNVNCIGRKGIIVVFPLTLLSTKNDIYVRRWGKSLTWRSFSSTSWVRYEKWLFVFEDACLVQGSRSDVHHTFYMRTKYTEIQAFVFWYVVFT
jgi:hypothetical protein